LIAAGRDNRLDFARFWGISKRNSLNATERAIEMSLKTSCTAILALSLLTAPAAWAQTGPGVSVHSKTTPSTQPAATEQQPPAAQPAQPQTPPPAAQAPSPVPPPAAALPAAPQQPAQPQQAGAQPGAPAPAPNAIGAGGGWSPQFTPSTPESSVFTGTSDQLGNVQKVDAYFNGMKNLEGNFVQTDADGKHKKGKFYLERPGKVRFDYALPSKQKIISDGRYLALEDHDLNTTDRHELESTPFRMLLTEKVDLLANARVIALDVGQDMLVIALEDKISNAGGQIRLFFSLPQFQLKEWLVTDAQGLNTRVELADVALNKPTDPKLFTFSPDLGMPKFKGSAN
jgi:outer membrane lipoprotein-sorting protein